MAQAATIRFSGYRVLISDGGSPATFSAPCGFNERSFNLTRELSETVTPDCADEDAPAWTERDTTSMSASITGQGVLDVSALAIWESVLDTTESVRMRVELWREGAKIRHWEGLFQLESFETSATRGERVNVNVSLQSDGIITRTNFP